MKKILGLILGLFLMVSPLYAVEIPEGQVIDLLGANGVTSLAIGGTSGSKFSTSFPMKYSPVYTLAIKTSAASNISVTVENGFSRPSTESTTDTSNYSTDSTTPTLTIVDTNLHIFSFAANTSPYARLKFTLGSGNSQSNTITTLKWYMPNKQ